MSCLYYAKRQTKEHNTSIGHKRSFSLCFMLLYNVAAQHTFLCVLRFFACCKKLQANVHYRLQHILGASLRSVDTFLPLLSAGELNQTSKVNLLPTNALLKPGKLGNKNGHNFQKFIKHSENV